MGTMDGIRSSSTFPISHVARMERIILKRCRSRFMQTAVFVGFTSLIVYTPRMNFHRSSSCFFQSRMQKKQKNEKLQIICNFSADVALWMSVMYLMLSLAYIVSSQFTELRVK